MLSIAEDAEKLRSQMQHLKAELVATAAAHEEEEMRLGQVRLQKASSWVSHPHAYIIARSNLFEMLVINLLLLQLAGISQIPAVCRAMSSGYRLQKQGTLSLLSCWRSPEPATTLMPASWSSRCCALTQEQGLTAFLIGRLVTLPCCNYGMHTADCWVWPPVGHLCLPA